jgi:5'-nucleotidase (lipoprotein e(P4) family)
MRRYAICAVLCSFFTLGMTPRVAPTYENLNAVLWMQTSVEYRASATQVYRLAEQALTRGLKNPHWTAALEQTGNYESLPPAVILDLDETVLDNSVFEARMVNSGESYSTQAWTKWVNERGAGLVPGAIEFLQFAHANGVAPLYITNRVCDPSKDDDATVRGLRSLQLPTEPIVDRLYCARSSDDSDKTARRAKCAAKYRILLLFGDQLGDFVQIPPEVASLEGREKLYEAHQNLWGERWFQLPNPMYGSWEGAVGYGLKEKLSRLRK